MAFLTGLLSIAENLNQPGGIPWEWLILKVFDFVSVYGWRIVLFTVLLKLLLYPLDIFQRYKMRKNQKITERLKPDLDKLQATYADNPQVLQQKQMELNKREGYSYFSACLPALITMIIFIWFFTSLNNISQYMIFKQYVEWYDKYEVAYSQVLDESDYNTYLAIVENENSTSDEVKEAQDKLVEIRGKAVEAGQNVVYDFYYDDDGNRESFLWIKNIWSPDVPWKKPILDASGFDGAVGNWDTDAKKSGLDETTLALLKSSYDDVTGKLQKDEGNVANGYLILPILAAGLSFLSQFLSMRLQKKSGQPQAAGMGGMKFMMFLFPILMIFFAVGYTSAFALYIVLNYGLTVLLKLLSTGIFALKDRGTEKKATETIIRYGRPDPHELIAKESRNSSDRDAGDGKKTGGNRKGK